MWLIISLGLILFLLFFVMSKSWHYWEERGVPVAPGREWFFGHYKQVLLVKRHIAHLYDELYNVFPEAPVVGYYRLNFPGLVVRDPEIIRTILITDFANYASNGSLVDKSYDVIAGWNPFFTKDPESWKMSRTHATPALSTSKLKGYLPSMIKVGDEMVKYVRKNCQATVVNLDLNDVSTMFTTDVMANAICGVNNNTFEDRNSFFATITGELARNLDVNVLENLKYLAIAAVPALNKIMQLRLTSKKLEKVLVSLTREIIRERAASGKKRNDVYQVMLGLRDNDDKGDEYITSQVFTILLDLVETSSIALMGALFTLAWHPGQQNKLRSEILDLKSKTNGQYTLEDVEKLKYLDMVLNESIRLYTPLSVLSRECTKDCTLALPGQKPLHIPEGTPVTIPISSIHADPKYYPDPAKFDPQRFSEEEIAKRPKFTFMPFGEGPKKCVGMRIATLQIKVGMMSILEHFKLKPCAKTSYPLDIDPSIFLFSRPTHGAWVTLEEIS